MVWKEPDGAALYEPSRGHPGIAYVGAIDYVIPGHQNGDVGGTIAFSLDCQAAFEDHQQRTAGAVPTVLVDAADRPNTSLHDVVSQAIRSGRKKAALATVRRALAQEIEDIAITTDHGVPDVHIVHSDGSVPVALSGDGIAALVRLAFELAAAPEGLVLLEEPECHMHSGALWQAAQAIWATVARGVQVVVSTHSLELIDALVAAAGKRDKELACFRLALSAGELKTTRISGPDVARRRAQFEEDLR